MIIKKIKLVNFRNHNDYILNCKKKTSLIVGENGSGKTSVLEGIYIALRGKSFRASDPEIKNKNSDFYRVEVEFSNSKKTIVTFDGNKKNFLIDDKKSVRLPKEYRYPVVLFLPDDLHLIKSSPTSKRDFFDRIIFSLDDNYQNLLNKYNKALKQRNELLKKESSKNDLFSWNILLSRLGVEIRNKRIKYIKEINKLLTTVYQTIADNDDEILINYQEEKLNESNYLKLLEDNYNKDKILGYTSFGIHRDNYKFLFNNRDADGSASRGEVRSIILALKFIEAELIYQKSNIRPLVLLDDVFSELDEKRQKCLVKNFKDNQVIITSVEEV